MRWRGKRGNRRDEGSLSTCINHERRATERLQSVDRRRARERSPRLAAYTWTHTHTHRWHKSALVHTQIHTHLGKQTCKHLDMCRLTSSRTMNVYHHTDTHAGLTAAVSPGVRGNL